MVTVFFNVPPSEIFDKVLNMRLDYKKSLTLIISIFLNSLLASDGICSCASLASCLSASASHGKNVSTIRTYSRCLEIDSLIRFPLKESRRNNRLYRSLISCSFCSRTHVWLVALTVVDKESGMLDK